MILTLLGCQGAALPDDPCANEYALTGLEGATVRTVGTFVPDDAGEPTIHVRLTWPDTREVDPWPAGLLLQGAWAHAISDDARLQVDHGLVEVRLDLPGGGQSGGVDDRRGPLARAGVAAVLRYMAGETTDLGGCTLARRTRSAGAERYLVGVSNGGNLAAAVLADPALDLPDVGGLVTWETPSAPQFVNVEHGGAPTVYQAGTCTLGEGVTCVAPTEHLLEVVAKDRAPELCYDLDGDSACGEADVRVKGVEDPASGLRVLSPTLTEAATGAGLTLPGHLGLAGATTWWAERDASRLAAGLVSQNPDLPVLLLGTEQDHVLTLADHPHVYGFGEALQRAGAAWTRLNPGAAALGAAGENAPNAALRLDDPVGRLLLEEEESPLGDLLAAAVLELSTGRADATIP